jgi:primosomal protein N' (replication factor Y)
VNQVPFHASYAEVLVSAPFDHTFDYEIPKDCRISRGSIVQVPFGSRQIFGVVEATKATSTTPAAKLKAIENSIEWCQLSEADLRFIAWVADYTLTPRGMILKMVLSVPPAFEAEKPQLVYAVGDLSQSMTAKQQQVVTYLQDHQHGAAKTAIADGAQVSAAVVRTMIDKGMIKPVILKASCPQPDPAFNQMQYSADQQIVADTLMQAVEQGHYQPILIDGVTGSGKTEVYFEAIAAALKAGKQSVVLLPEISLTPQWLERFKKRFRVEPLKWHSHMTQAQRRRAYRLIARGEGKVIVGARSALMLPYAQLGCIIVDEEHESSYKQEEQVIYHARDMAVARAFHLDIPVVLVSATPSLETYVNAKEGKYCYLSLSQRHGGATLPNMELIDMRGILKPAREPRWISPALRHAMTEALAQQEQTLLFLNRRGYAPLTICRTCGERLQCPNCSAWLVQHKALERLQCHHCGFIQPKPKICPKCQETETFMACGPGVERIAEEVKTFLPDARLLIMASDAFDTTDELAKAIQHIQEGHVDIIIGTQIMAKGHHFPKLTLVGVIDADLGLSGGDLRACERTYQLLQQVAGRCGRAERQGYVFLQTYYPDHPVLQALCAHDRDAFLEQEVLMRRTAEMPPYTRLAAIIVSGKDSHFVEKWIKDFRRYAPQTANKEEPIEILGPVQAPLAVLRRYYRWRILVRSPKNFPIQKYIRDWKAAVTIPHSIKFQVDIDPISFM